MAKSRNKKSLKQSIGKRGSKANKKSDSAVENASNAAINSSDIHNSSVSVDCETGFSIKTLKNAGLSTDEPLKMPANDGSELPAKRKKTVNRGPRKVKRLSSARSVLLPWPSRNQEQVIRDSEILPLHRRLRRVQKIKNESQITHRCFDFAYECALKPCCLASKTGCWNSRSCRNQMKHGSDVKEKSAASQSTNQFTLKDCTTSTAKNSDLPGFYFDPEKRRYFRIVPSATNVMSNVVTQERVAFENHERLRQKEILSLETSGKLTDPKHQTTMKKIPSILTSLERSKISEDLPGFRMHDMRRACIARMGTHVGKKLQEFARGNIKKMCLKSDETKLLVSYQSRKYYNVSVINVDQLFIPASDICQSDIFEDILFCSNQDKVADLCFMPFPNESKQTLVYCTTGGEVNMFNEKILSMKWERKIKDMMLCCSSRSSLTAFGTECAVYVSKHLSMNSYIELTKFNTSRVAVHSLAFANATSNLLFCGAKNRRILLFDRRFSTEKPAAYLSQHGGFSGDIYVTKDDRYLLSADLNSSQIQKWDIRRGQVVVDYPGHVNDCGLRTPLVVNRDEDFFCAVGTDGYSRIWDLRSGELMKVLPPPIPAHSQRLPSVCFMSGLPQNRNIHPGLLMGISNQLYFFSL